jgi:hypothetical protein
MLFACGMGVTSLFIMYVKYENLRKENEQLKDRINEQNIQKHVDSLSDSQLNDILDKRLGSTKS